MSIFYHVNEHLSIKDTTECCDFLNAAVIHFSDLGSLLLRGDAVVHKLTLVANGTTKTFSGRGVTSDLQDLMDALKEASSVDLVADYDYIWFAGCPGIEHTMLSDLIEEEMDLDDTFADNVFYSMYNKADCSDGAGILCAHSKKDGVVYHGAVNPVAAELPQEGTWCTTETSVMFDDDLTEEMDAEQIKRCADAYASLGTNADVDFDADESGVALFVNYLQLNSKADLEKFIEISRQLLVATAGQAGFEANFACFDKPDTQLLSIVFADDGAVTVKKASV